MTTFGRGCAEFLATGAGTFTGCLGATRTGLGLCKIAGELAGEEFCALAADAVAIVQIAAKRRGFTSGLTEIRRVLFGRIRREMAPEKKAAKKCLPSVR